MDLSPTGSNFPHAISVGKDLQKWNGVVHMLEVWVEVECMAKVVPYFPGGAVGILALARDAISGNTFDNVEFSSNSISGVIGASVQEGCTGNVIFM
jgi:hypothetical protein